APADAGARLCPALPPRDPAGRPRLRFRLPAQTPARRRPRLMTLQLDPAHCLPEDGCAGTLIGRAWLPGEGPAVVLLREDGVFDISRTAPTSAGLLNEPDPAAVVAAAPRDRRIGDLATVLANSAADGRDPTMPFLLAPIDLQ